MPAYVSCIVDAFARPPNPVNISADSFEILELDFTDKNLFLNISWDYPNVVYGIAREFEIRIAREYLGPTEIDDPTDYSLRQLTTVRQHAWLYIQSLVNFHLK